MVIFNIKFEVFMFMGILPLQATSWKYLFLRQSVDVSSLPRTDNGNKGVSIVITGLKMMGFPNPWNAMQKIAVSWFRASCGLSNLAHCKLIQV